MKVFGKGKRRGSLWFYHFRGHKWWQVKGRDALIGFISQGITVLSTSHFHSIHCYFFHLFTYIDSVHLKLFPSFSLPFNPIHSTRNLLCVIQYPSHPCNKRVWLSVSQQLYHQSLVYSLVTQETIERCTHQDAHQVDTVIGGTKMLTPTHQPELRGATTL